MRKARSKLPIALVWWELLVSGIISWAIKKILDYYWKKVGIFWATKPSHSLRKFGIVLMQFSWNLISTSFDPADPFVTRFILNSVYMSLRQHRKLHLTYQYEKGECKMCQFISFNKKSLLEFIPNPELYPPFES